jgi:hypothetical protein
MHSVLLMAASSWINRLAALSSNPGERPFPRRKLSMTSPRTPWIMTWGASIRSMTHWRVCLLRWTPTIWKASPITSMSPLTWTTWWQAHSSPTKQSPFLIFELDLRIKRFRRFHLLISLTCQHVFFHVCLWMISTMILKYSLINIYNWYRAPAPLFFFFRYQFKKTHFLGG